MGAGGLFFPSRIATSSGCVLFVMTYLKIIVTKKNSKVLRKSLSCNDIDVKYRFFNL